jgi:hypothetical protein
MRAAEKIWPSLTTTENRLWELVSDGLIQDQGLGYPHSWYSKFILYKVWSSRFSPLYSICRTHSSSISSSIHCGVHLSLYLNISM